MTIGIICEGRSDRAVIENILTGITGMDFSDYLPLRPTDILDETDKANIDPLTFSSWSIVKAECEERKRINDFFSIEGNDFVVIHLDSAEAEEYPVPKPSRTSASYCSDLRNAIIAKMNEWLKLTPPVNNIVYAIAIEEIDAWILTIFDRGISANSVNPKKKLAYILGKRGIKSDPGYDSYLFLSKDFARNKVISDPVLLSRNESLLAFCDEIRVKIVPALV